MQEDLKRLVDSVWRNQPHACLNTEITSTADWHELNYARIRTVFIAEVLSSDPNEKQATTMLTMLEQSALTALVDESRRFGGPEVEIDDIRYTRIMQVIHAARRMPTDYPWTEQDLLYAARLAIAQTMLVTSDEEDYVMSKSIRIFAHLHSFLLPFHQPGMAMVFANEDYRTRVRQLLLGFLLMMEARYK